MFNFIVALRLRSGHSTSCLAGSHEPQGGPLRSNKASRMEAWAGIATRSVVTLCVKPAGSYVTPICFFKSDFGLCSFSNFSLLKAFALSKYAS